MIEPKKVTVATLRKLVAFMKDGSDKAIGNYFYKGFRIQISRYGVATNERVKRLYRQRREKGLCIICSKKIDRKNPKTKKLYRLCDKHRKEIDKKKKPR